MKQKLPTRKYEKVGRQIKAQWKNFINLAGFSIFYSTIM